MATMQMSVRPEDLSQLPQGAERIPDPGILVIFGASSDLTKRKLLPAYFHLFQANLLPRQFAIVGVARRPLGDAFAADMRAGIVEFGGVEATDPRLDSFVSHISYFPLNFDDPSHYAALKTELDRIAKEKGIGDDRLFYLATAPEFFAGIIENLGAQGMAQSEKGRVAVVIEKPFGHDLDSARELNHQVNAVFQESQVFRIDHYLGKETVQNLLVFRFANGIFEPIWKRNYIDHVQITVAETVGVEHRGGYYERAGALRDMVQNHLSQLLCLVAMEAPVSFNYDDVRNKKVDVLHALRPISRGEVQQCVVRGQYGQGELDGKKVRIGIELAFGKLLVTPIQLFFDHPGSLDRLFNGERRQVHHAGIGIPVDYRIPLFLYDLSGMLDDCPSHGCYCSPDLPVKKPEPGIS